MWEESHAGGILWEESHVRNPVWEESLWNWSGETRIIQAFGIEKITAHQPAVSMAAAAELLGVEEELIHSTSWSS